MPDLATNPLRPLRPQFHVNLLYLPLFIFGPSIYSSLRFLRISQTCSCCRSPCTLSTFVLTCHPICCGLVLDRRLPRQTLEDPAIEAPKMASLNELTLTKNEGMQRVQSHYELRPCYRTLTASNPTLSKTWRLRLKGILSVQTITPLRHCALSTHSAARAPILAISGKNEMFINKLKEKGI